MKSKFIWAVALLLSGCGSAPLQPSPISSVNVTGRVVEVLNGNPIGNVSVEIAGQTLVTDGSGGFRVGLSPNQTAQITLRGGSVVTRTTRVSGTEHEVLFSLFPSASFDLNFYRQLVRNSTEGSLQPIRRWTKAPVVYLKTVTESGSPISSVQLDSTESVIRESIPQWSGFNPIIERGTESRVGDSRYVTVRWLDNGDGSRCGEAQVGQEGGYINLFTNVGGGCSCNDLSVRPRTVRHEVGHAMGFWHTSDTNDIMSGIPVSGCDGNLSGRETYYSKVAYQRPVGNTDEDNDPVNQVYLKSVVVSDQK